jgi:hypothetical protein
VGAGTDLLEAPAYRRHPRETKKCYKPTSTRLPFLFGVLIIALTLIALVEVACHRYPVQNNPSLWGLNLTRRAPFDGAEDENPNQSGFRTFEDIDIRKSSSCSHIQPLPILNNIQETQNFHHLPNLISLMRLPTFQILPCRHLFLQRLIRP